jgi:uncharacterized protein Yka (UPF0111/DUF47 family)
MKYMCKIKQMKVVGFQKRCTSRSYRNNKLKEMYETLEGALDRCADVADVIEDIALKYGNG